jgi:hypothetical protein
VESAEFLYGDVMKFALFQKIKTLKFEHFLFLDSLETAFLVCNFEKSNYLKNKEFLTNGRDRSPYSDANFWLVIMRFLSLMASLVVLQGKIFLYM